MLPTQAERGGAQGAPEGPTALTFVRGDAAAAAKAIADFQKHRRCCPSRAASWTAPTLDAAQITAISKLPSRQVLYGQLVGIVASPITGLARSLNGLVSGLAIALGGVLEKKESGELPSGEAPAAAAAPEAEAPAAAADTEPTD